MIAKLEKYNEINRNYSRIKYSLQKQGIVKKELGNFREGAGMPKKNALSKSSSKNELSKRNFDSKAKAGNDDDRFD